MNTIQANIFLGRKLKEIKSLNKNYSFSKSKLHGGNWDKYKDYNGEFIIRMFIIDKDGCSVGKMALKVSHNSFSLYVKHYKPDGYPYEASDDDFFFMLEHYATTGEQLLSATIRYFEKCAVQIQQQDYQRKVDWRIMNPKQGKNKRKRLQKKSIKNIIRKLILRMAELGYNGWGLSKTF